MIFESANVFFVCVNCNLIQKIESMYMIFQHAYATCDDYIAQVPTLSILAK